MNTTSHRRIFRTSAIIGSASIINILIGIIKVKALAVLLGPAGVGLMGAFQNIVGMAATLSGCGLGNSGVRQLAAHSDDARTFAIVRRSIWLLNVGLGAVGMLILWLMREPIASWIFGNSAYSTDIGWLGIGVLLTLVSGSQTALLQGMRRIGDLARVGIASSIVGSATGTLFVYFLRESGVLWFVLVAPAVSILVASYYSLRQPKHKVVNDWATMWQQSGVMLKLGIPIMAGGLITMATQLAARSIILQELGIDAAGHFQAAWAISMTYIGFVLGAMGADYYPNLTSAIRDPAKASKLVSEQTEIALLLAGPVLLAMLTFAPWVINAVYSETFEPASNVLRWQVIGDILKVASWPMGYIILAKGRGGLFITTDLLWNTTYIVSLKIGMNANGLEMAGISFLLAYAIHAISTAFLATRLVGYRTTRRNFILMLSITGAAITIMLLEIKSATTNPVSVAVTISAIAYSAKRLESLISLKDFIKNRLKK